MNTIFLKETFPLKMRVSSLWSLYKWVGFLVPDVSTKEQAKERFTNENLFRIVFQISHIFGFWLLHHVKYVLHSMSIMIILHFVTFPFVASFYHTSVSNQNACLRAHPHERQKHAFFEKLHIYFKNVHIFLKNCIFL